jgi:hypothetical protein
MNLKELTQEVNTALDYNPDLSAYKDQVARVLNRHYLQISSQYPWLFRQKVSQLTLRADITGDATTNKVRVGQADTFDASNVITFYGTADTLPTREMLGNTLVINDNDTYTTRESYSHGASEREFTITAIFDLNTNSDFYGSQGVYGGTDSDEWPDGYQPKDSSGIILDRPIIDPSTVSSHAVDTKDYYNDWKIEFRQYYLPADCIEVLGVMDRGLKTSVHTQSSGSISTTVNTAPNRGRIMFIDSSKEEHLFLDRDSSGDPVLAVEGMAVHQDAPMAPPHIHILERLNSDSILKHARLYGGNTYEYCYTFVYAGLESPPSPVTRVTLPEDIDHYAAKISSQGVEGDFRRNSTYGRTIVDTDVSRGSAKTDADAKLRLNGRIKRFYRRKVQEPGDNTSLQWQGYQRWLHIGDHFTDGAVYDIGRKQSSFADLRAGEEVVSFPDDSEGLIPVLGWPQSQRLELGRWTYHDGELSKLKILDESGPRQTIRVYRPPSQDMDVEIRYLSRPKRLVADADTPEWPVQYHHLLVYMALADICLQHGISSQSQLYEKKAEDLLDRMRQKYLARANRKYVRGSFDRAVFAGERWGTPSKIG